MYAVYVVPLLRFMLGRRQDWDAKSACSYPDWSLKKAVKDIDEDIYKLAIEEWGSGVCRC